MNSFGQRLRLLREEKKMVQKEIAGLIDVSESTVGKYENGLRTPTPETIIKLAKYFEVSSDYLLGYSEIRETAEEILKNLKIDPTISENALKEIEDFVVFIKHKYKDS